jgi:methanogenic corrinoid protein MtbC1
LQELGIAKQVVVMEGGFDKFSELYQADASVVEAATAPKLSAAAAAVAEAAAHSEQH